ncbi:band 4.1-like protein 4 isoform X2 [Homalodisca vitripennis]|uniref:band 4.1-like protein 4 isoform X2 n=1 Tax=Homalodisca vitripennis TaxID=197043 RepID=UPI001EEBABED|nr:band 4.1-like protein 4 isoform X2 [Homalodisca vitripennis]
MFCLCSKARTHHCKVVLLDEQELIQEIQDSSPGQEVLDTVFRHLNLLETAYFGLRYLDAANQTHWLDTTKKVSKQLKGKETFTLYFGVKFYAADPCKLLEEITRYQFFLQVKQDILQGRLPVSFELAAELGAFVVQSELGDYDPRRHSPGYVSEFRFLSNQTVELEGKIAEHHKDLQGQLPSVAELNYLDKVKWLEMYGVDLHPVLGEDNVEYFLGLTPTGVIVLRNKNKVANYYWPRISKIYHKGRYFMLRVCDKNNDENTYGFETPSKPACKHLYKCCVEHHAFFRLVQVSPNPPDVIGTRFSGRAEKISQREAQMRLRSPPQFTRTPSRRYQRRIVEGAQDAPKVEEQVNNENIPPQEMKTISIPQPVNSVSSLYRGTVPATGRCDSPRSTRSAPWSVPHARGLYTGSSPRSLRSAGHTRSLAARRSSSVESHSSNDSRSCKKHRHHRSRRSSDNESELSRCSGGKSRRHRHRSRRASGSEHDSGRHSSKSSRHRYELVESESQWKEVQRKQAEGSSGIQQATVVSSKESQPRPRSGYMNSGMETESEHSYHHRRKHRKHRSRSRSPSDSKSRLPEELKQHLQFQLVETEGMSEQQLREIPYKVVETATASKAVRVRLSPTSKRRNHSARRPKSCSLKEEPPSTGDSPPPPYSESPAAPSTPSALQDILNKNTQPPQTTQLPRVGHQQSRMSSSATNRSLCSALYGNPTTLLGNPNLPPSGAGHNGTSSPHRRDSVDNSAWLGREYNQSPGKSSSSSLIGISERRKSDLPPRPFPFNSMRSQNSYSSNHGKQWTSPEVRGTVGLPWPAIVDGLYNPPATTHQPYNPTTPHSSYTNLPEHLSRYPSPQEQLHANLNSSHEFLQHVHAATSYITYGTPLHRPYRDPTQVNGNLNHEGSNSRRYDHSSIHSSASSELNREHSSSSSSSLRNRSNLSIDQSSSKTSLYDHTKLPNRVEKKPEEGVSSPNHNQSEEKRSANENWPEGERGPLYFHQSDNQNTNTLNGVRKEVNNNPRVLHEMSTEL